MTATVEAGQKSELKEEAIPYKKISKKPRTLKENWQQQTLPAWQPVFTAGRIAPGLFLIGLLFVPIGVGIWIFSNNIQEVNILYTDCLNILQSVDYPEDFNKSCAEVMTLETALYKNCTCRLKFNITTDLTGPVYVYYGLTNFYQNHRQYLSSRDDRQLRGDEKLLNEDNPRDPSNACKDYDYEMLEDCIVDFKSENVTLDKDKKKCRIYLPCGAIANSMFSDEIKLFHNFLGRDGENASQIVVPLNRTKIAWDSDKNYKFKNPLWFYKYHNDTNLQSKFVKPKNWRKNLWELDPADPDNNGLKNEDLIVWMRVAALPTFRKLFRIVNQWETREFQKGLPKGEYMLEIDYYFPVVAFDGTKSIILSTTSILGASNPFLGVSYVITGTVCIILAIFLLVVHVKTRELNRKVIETQILLQRNDTSNKTYYGT